MGMDGDTLITDPGRFERLCAELRQADWIAFDTEFVPEYTFAPILCLVQVMAGDRLAAIDPFAVGDLTPFWQAVLRPGVEVILHAGKEELNFCFSQAGRLPDRVFDVQLAAGLVGLGYPLSHGNLVQRVLGQQCRTTETRTDWRRRPLSDEQVVYALDDVRHLRGLRDKITGMLAEMDRASWYQDESADMLAAIRSRDEGQRWRRLSGSGSLTGRGLAVLREIAIWRDKRAKQLDKPPRWILRDDLVAELAKRQPTSLRELQNTRGLERIGDVPWARDLLDAIKKGQEVPDDELPERVVRRETPDEQMVQKLVSAGLLHFTQGQQVATSLVGNNEDLRDLMDWRAAGCDPELAPRLARGWRMDVCGRKLVDLLGGKVNVRVDRGKSGLRLVFDGESLPEEG